MNEGRRSGLEPPSQHSPTSEENRRSAIPATSAHLGHPPPLTDDVVQPPDEGEEHRQGLSPRHQRISSLLTQLATTARSFLFYDARNEAIHHFLSALVESFVTILEAEQQIVLSVQPFEMWFEGEAVYLNRDRDRSLAFRLYRDGVRALKFQAGFQWEELARLLEILSVRYTGVHQNEDDAVTLLWKANFKHLDIVAVEGFAPEDEGATEPLTFAFEGNAAPVGGEGRSEEESRLPDTVDLPRPYLPSPQRPEWLEVSEGELERLRAEVAGSALPEECLALLRRLRRQLVDRHDPFQFADVAHLFTEIRDFLLADEYLGSLAAFLDFLIEMGREEPPRHDQGRQAAILELVKSCGDHRSVQRLLHSVPLEERHLRPEMVKVLDRACPDPIDAVIAAMPAEKGHAARAVSRQLLEHYGKGKESTLIQRFEHTSGQVACDLLRVITHVGGEGVAPFVAQQCSHPDSEVQEEALRHLSDMPYSGAVGKAMFDAFRRSGDDRQVRLLAAMAHTGDRRFLDLLTRHLEDHGGQIAPDLAAQMGRTLGRIGGEGSFERWQAWLKPGGLFRKTLPGSPARQIASAMALGEIPGESSAQALRAALVAAGPDSHDWIGRALAHQRGTGRHT